MDKEKAILIREKIKAAQIMLAQIDEALADFLQVEIPQSEEFHVEETFLGDDGKEYSKQTPYIKAEQWYCCGQPLEKEGKEFICRACGSRYSA